MTSPDSYHQVRVIRSNLAASHVNLQNMENVTHGISVDEYQLEMLLHLTSLELTSMPNLQLIQQQPEINLKMRPLLLDFLMDVINKLGLSKSTFPLTVNLIDRYCSTRIVKKQHYQLLGLTSLWISCKNSDSKFKIPSIYDLCKMCCNCYDKRLFLEMENHLLKSLNWAVESPTFDQFIDLYLNIMLTSNLAGSSLKNHINDIKVLSIYICELAQFYPNIHFTFTSSQVSLGVIVVAIRILNINLDLPAYLNYFNYKILNKEVLNQNTFNSFFLQLVKILKCPTPSLKMKYFNQETSNGHLLKMLVKFANNHTNEPTTPKFSTVHLPPTPVSNNISPREAYPPDVGGSYEQYHYQSNESNEKSHLNQYPDYNIIATPESIPKKRSVVDMEPEPVLSDPPKRSKAAATFYIS